jgi:hypothetical protein
MAFHCESWKEKTLKHRTGNGARKAETDGKDEFVERWKCRAVSELRTRDGMREGQRLQADHLSNLEREPVNAENARKR